MELDPADDRFDEERFDEEYVDRVIEQLSAQGIGFSQGLSREELDLAEHCLGAPLPPELGLLYGAALPVGEGFANWRDPVAEVRWTAEWIDRAFAFDIEHNSWWPPFWDVRPKPIDEALAILRKALASAPPLVHVRGHRFMATEPRGRGNPVLSIWQASDSIYYGYDLADYLHKEFHLNRPWWAATEPPRVPFWGDMLDLLQEWPH
jgi:hypothetical protein